MLKEEKTVAKKKTWKPKKANGTVRTIEMLQVVFPEDGPWKYVSQSLEDDLGPHWIGKTGAKVIRKGGELRANHGLPGGFVACNLQSMYDFVTLDDKPGEVAEEQASQQLPCTTEDAASSQLPVAEEKSEGNYGSDGSGGW